VISTTSYQILVSKLIMIWLITSVKHGSYAVLMENRCTMASKHWFFNMNGSILHSGKRFNDIVSFECHISCLKKKLRLDKFIFKYQRFMAILNLFSIKKNCVRAMFYTYQTKTRNIGASTKVMNRKGFRNCKNLAIYC
jgi:hypothetical protein